jgi:ribosomal protein S18 acetylase RimI-like enzyme
MNGINLSGTPIVALDLEKEITTCVEVICRSFQTVAAEFGITRENAPTNPAFMTLERIQGAAAKGAVFFGAFPGKVMEGCVAVEPSHDDPRIFYIERLAVLPESRHKGLGRMLMSHAEAFIKERGGATASIGLMNENTALKNWYLSLGFMETRIQKFPHMPFTVCFMEKRLD